MRKKKFGITVVLGLVAIMCSTASAWNEDFSGAALDSSVWALPGTGDWTVSNGNLVLASGANGSNITANFPAVSFATDPNIYIKSRIKCLNTAYGLELTVGQAGNNRKFVTYMNAALGWIGSFPPSGTGYLFYPFFLPGPNGEVRPTDNWYSMVIVINKTQTPYTVSLYINGDLKIFDDGDTNWLSQLTQIDTVTLQVTAVDTANPWYLDYLYVTHDPSEVLPPCGDPGTVYFRGDISGPAGVRDCRVDMYDLAVMIQNWLSCTDPNPTNCP